MLPLATATIALMKAVTKKQQQVQVLLWAAVVRTNNFAVRFSLFFFFFECVGNLVSNKVREQVTYYAIQERFEY